MEFLAEMGLPFVAAGRSASRIKAVAAEVPGIAAADYEVAEVDLDAASLKRLLTGTKVVCNTVGPFAKLGASVAQAALEAGCHYVDTSGEQPWLFAAKNEFGAAFKKAGLVLAPSTAALYTTADIAVHLARELVPGADTIDVVNYLNGAPTTASTQSIFDLLRSPAYQLIDNKLVEWDPSQVYSVLSPNGHELIDAAPWGGTSLPAWYLDDPEIRNVKALTGWMSRGLVRTVVDIAKQVTEQIKGKSEAEVVKYLEDTASGIQSGTPPRENPRINRYCDSATVRGTLGAAQVALFGHSAYRQTGLYQAAAAALLLGDRFHQTGFTSPCAAFGARTLLGYQQHAGMLRPQTIFAG
ncbi:hypothetical protein WM33_20105 [Burkholderia multivorans]|nr:hypothetical protein WM33_20105 [Burkholderia multivorans]KVZ80351.1 hypothetical protein WL23_14120 [Burkholderia multivorans]